MRDLVAALEAAGVSIVAAVAPLNSPASGYTFDGVREGIAQAR